MYVNSISLVKCVSWVGEHISLGICVLLQGNTYHQGYNVSCVIFNITRDKCSPIHETHITRNMCPTQGKTYHWGYVFPEQVNTYQQVNRCAFSGKRKRISLQIFVSWEGEHISLEICVSWLGEHISLEICVSCVGEHI